LKNFLLIRPFLYAHCTKSQDEQRTKKKVCADVVA
jgi:hypothetical protein